MLLSYFLDFQIIVAIISVFSAWKWGDWKNWQIYYPTMLFTTLANFTSTLLTYNFPLWEMESPVLKTIGSDMIFGFVGFPSLILVYLTHVPKQLLKQVMYILAWIILITLIERLSYILGFFSYFNGWSIWWSLLFNCVMFPLIWLHHKKPLWAIGASLIFAVLIISYFHIPFSSMK